MTKFSCFDLPFDIRYNMSSALIVCVNKYNENYRNYLGLRTIPASGDAIPRVKFNDYDSDADTKKVYIVDYKGRAKDIKIVEKILLN